jgi:hypothetical protein
MKNKHFRTLLTPSWLSTFVGVTLALLITGATVVISNFQGSQLQQQLFENQARATAATTTSGAYSDITSNIAGNKFLSDVPLLLVWGAVGLVVYFGAMAVARSLGNAAGLREQLNYMNVSREALIKQTAINFVIRLAAIAVWLGLLIVTLKMIGPYALASASLAQTLTVESVGFVLLAVLILFITTQAHAICLRLIALRPRIFTR